MGSLGALLFTALPPPWFWWLLVVCGCVLLLNSSTRWLAAMLLACCWSLWNFQSRLDDRLDPALGGQVRAVSGVIASMPQNFEDYVSFRFEPDNSGARDGLARQQLPHSLLLRWYEDWPELSAGQRWRFELLLKPPWGPVNFRGPDRERWLFANGIGGVATIRGGQLEAEPGLADQYLVRLREMVFQRIGQHVADPRKAATLQALAVAERSGLAHADRQLLALTGTAHLLAISGLHIGLAAAGGMLMVRLLGSLMPLALLARGSYLLLMAGGAFAAAAYAALAGFGVPTVRALAMLLAMMAAVSARRAIHPARAWLLALAAVLLFDPFAPLGAGFWFSFTAVAALLWLFVPRRRRHGWRALPLAQAAVMLMMLPISGAWFQSFSWVGFAANLVAIPLVSFGVVPFVLAGVVALAVSSQAAALLWSVAAGASGLLLGFLEWMAVLQGRMTPLTPPGLATALCALLGAAILLLPRGMPGRWLGVLLLAPLLLPPAPREDDDALELEILDAGQGTAVLLRSGRRVLLYDSGPGDGAGRDMVHSVIAPSLEGAGQRAPDRVIISHGDLDHAGGLGSLRLRYPRTPVYASLRRPDAGLRDCRTPLAWAWLDTRFRVLHPSAGLPYLGNDSSCVLSVERLGRRILLSGDISSAVEARLLRAGLQQSDVLLVPHHGSLSSSSTALIHAVSPRVAVATAGLGNRFGFPLPEVRRRYDRAGIPFWWTGQCGAIRIVLHGDGRLDATSARLQRPAIWRWPADELCPGEYHLPRARRHGANDQSAPHR